MSATRSGWLVAPWLLPQAPYCTKGQWAFCFGECMMTVTMPMELQIIRALEFIRLGAGGHFSLEASEIMLADLAATSRKRPFRTASSAVSTGHSL